MPVSYGVNVTDQAGQTPPARDGGGVVLFAVGTAPGTGTAATNEPVLCRTLADYYEAFGKAADGESADGFTLDVLARVYLGRYRAAPAVFVNVYVPATHVGGPSDVGADDVAGADDGAGGRTGVEVVEEVFTATGLVPSLLAAPGFGHEPAVRAALRTKAASHSRSFRAHALLDVAPDVDNAAAAVAAKATAGDAGAPLNDPHATLCWPQPRRLNADKTFTAEPMSAHVAGAIGRAAAENGGVPLRSPSNTDLLAADLSVTLSLQDVDLLRDAGIVTAQRFGPGGFRLAGNRTTAYVNGEATAESAEEALRDSFIADRMVADHVANRIVLDALELVDGPVSAALVDQVLARASRLGNALKASGATLGFRASFESADNPAAQLADGRVVFRVAFLPPPPMERVDVLLSVDLGYLSNLFA